MEHNFSGGLNRLQVANGEACVTRTELSNYVLNTSSVDNSLQGAQRRNMS